MMVFGIFSKKILSIFLFSVKFSTMIATNKKKSAVVFMICIFLITGMAAFSPAPQGGYKNLQVLPKDITKENLEKVMRSFNDALGVKCAFCHVHTGDDWKTGWDHASDDKEEKGIARHMLKMTMDINANYFNFENSTRTDTIRVVTCVTCHRGIAHPDGKNIAEQMQKLGLNQAPPPPPKN